MFNLKDCRQTGRVAVMVVLLGSLNRCRWDRGTDLVGSNLDHINGNGDNVSNLGRRDLTFSTPTRRSTLLSSPCRVPHHTAHHSGASHRARSSRCRAQARTPTRHTVSDSSSPRSQNSQTRPTRYAQTSTGCARSARRSTRSTRRSRAGCT